MNKYASLREKADQKVKLGFTGVGGRGTALLKMCLTMEDVEVLAFTLGAWVGYSVGSYREE